MMVGKLIDNGDKWKDMRRSFYYLDQRAVMVHYLIHEAAKVFMRKFYFRSDLEILGYEFARPIERQARLVAGSKSWVKNISTAPHVEWRAIDYVCHKKEEDLDNGWIWHEKIITEFSEWLRTMYPVGGSLRKPISHDIWHMEVMRSSLVWPLPNDTFLTYLDMKFGYKPLTIDHEVLYGKQPTL